MGRCIVNAFFGSIFVAFFKVFFAILLSLLHLSICPVGRLLYVLHEKAQTLAACLWCVGCSNPRIFFVR